MRTEEYEARLDELLRQVARKTPRATFGQYVAGAQGAFPGDVVKRLALLGFSWRVEGSELSPTSEPVPELHALDFEWLFTPESARTFAESLASSEAVLLGLPTVAARMSTSFTLVERNPFTVLRDPGLADRGTVLLSDVRAARSSLPSGAKTVGFDPPWYLDETLLWLSLAADVCGPGSRIQFVLFPAMIRPDAGQEREHILEQCESIGSVTVAPEQVAYGTPRFELEAMGAAGAPRLARWRHGDLVTIEVARRDALRPLTAVAPLAGSQWKRYRVGSRVVKVRPSDGQPPGVGDFTIDYVDGLSSWTLPSVSLSAPARRDTNIWTSRNRVARVRNTSDAHRLLSRLARIPDPEMVKRYFRSYEWAHRPQEAALWTEFLDVDDLGRWSLRQCTSA